MDGEMDDWFSSWSGSFKSLPSPEKASAIIALISICDVPDRYMLLNLCFDILNGDIISRLPNEILQQVMGLLAPKDLLSACKVCHKWQLCLSQQMSVWKKKWLELGLGTEEDVARKSVEHDWYADCKVGQDFHDKIAIHDAIDYQMDSFQEELGCVSAMDYSENFLAVCHYSKSGGSIYQMKVDGTWSFHSSFDAALHGYCTSVRLLRSGLMIVGHSSGKITMWQLKSRGSSIPLSSKGCSLVQLLQACHGHTSVVVAVDGNENLRVAASGSRDRRVKMWSIDDGTCLKTADFPSSVFQVSFYSAGVAGHSFMLVHCEGNISILSWDTADVDWKKNISYSRCHVASGNIIPGVHVCKSNIYYSHCTKVNGIEQYHLVSKPLDFNALIGQTVLVTSDSETRQFQIPTKVRKLLKVGLRFALFISDDNIVILDILNGKSGFQEFVPYSAATSVALPQITTGPSKWLDGLIYIRPRSMLLAMAVHGGNLAIVSWSASLRTCTSALKMD